jgi:peroxiredoxin
MSSLLGPVTGEILPDFVLCTSDQDTVRLVDLMGEKGMLLAFIHGTWCPACVHTVLQLQRYTRQYAGAGVRVAVVAADQAHRLDAFKRSAAISIDFPLLSDADSTLRHRLNLQEATAYLLVDSARELRGKYIDVDHLSLPGHYQLMGVLQTVFA